MAHIYTSRTLNELIQQSLEKVCEEQAHNIRLKNLLTKLLGDDPWINLGKMQWPAEDHEAIAQDRSDALLRQFAELRSSNGIGRVGAAEANGKPAANGRPKPTTTENGVEDGDSEMAAVNGHAGPPSAAAAAAAAPGGPEEDAQPTTQEGTVVGDDDSAKESKTEPTGYAATPPPETHRMTTRSALNNSNNSNAVASPAPPPSETPSVEVDAFFFPPNYVVDRDYGLPPAEAEETRRLVSAAVQRQDEFMRGLKMVQEGLLRAENMRKKVWEWCRTMEGVREYHQQPTRPKPANFDIDLGEGVGLSDGEDWYDKEAWKLEEELGKGHEEEDEGDVVPHGKKTRRRGDR